MLDTHHFVEKLFVEQFDGFSSNLLLFFKSHFVEMCLEKESY